MDYPEYRYPPGLLPAFLFDVLLLRRRSFYDDAQACVAMLKPPLHIWGKENIPHHGPAVLTVNHYHRPGFGAQWLALAIAASVPANMHWVVTSEFMYPGKWYKPLGRLASRWLLKRISRIYDFTPMPAMPPRANDVEARAASVRAVLEYVRHTQEPLLGLAPEGYDTQAGDLVRPPSGAGRFGLLLSKAGLKFFPIGAYEADGVFHLHFGRSYELRVETGLAPDEKDQQAAQTIMRNIARHLPLHLRGEFVEET